MGRVKKFKELEFSDHGDSGALVYAMDDNCMIPLGLHLGRAKSLKDQSIFLCLDAFAIAAQKAGLGLISLR
jgi:hypothetical protein